MRILEQLLGGLRGVCASFPDGRQWRPGNIEIADAGMAAFSLFFMQSESFLAHLRRLEHGRNGSNCKTLFGIEKIPSDNHIRGLLDPAPPGLPAPCFEHTLELMLGTGADFLFVCKKDGHKTLYEYVKGAPLDERTVIERRPGKRSLTYRCRWIEAVPLRDGKDGVPADRSSSVGWKDGLSVNWLEVTITNETGKTTYDEAFVTSLPLTVDNVVEVAACARARWKIENESFNVLKNHGYHLEHNFGHGKQHLAQVFVLLNLLAFAFHAAVCKSKRLYSDQPHRRYTARRPSTITHSSELRAYRCEGSSGTAPEDRAVPGQSPHPACNEIDGADLRED